MTRPSAGRPDGRPRQKSIDRSGRPMCTNMHSSLGWWAGRPGGRPSRELCYLEMAPIDRQRAAAFCIQSRSTGRSTGGTTVIKMTVGPVDRKGKSTLSCCQWAEFLWGYKYPLLWVVLVNNFKSKNSDLLKCFSYKF